VRLRLVVFVAGGTGALGRHLIPALITDGHQVTASTRSAGAITYDRHGHVVNVLALDIADGVVQAVRCVVNPDKLRHLGPVSELARRPRPGKR
jgi:nucleoside-diphosphate-sugar epimerase